MNPVNLAQTPFPDAIENLAFEDVLRQIKNDFTQKLPEYTQTVEIESEPITQLLNIAAYRETLLRQRINNGLKDMTLAFATGKNLDSLAANYNITRLTLSEEDTSTSPVTPAVMESDNALRYRCLLAWESMSTAGSYGSYEFWARSASGEVKDVSITSPSPGRVVVTVMAHGEDPVPSASLLTRVNSSLSAETVRPLGDDVSVNAVQVIDYNIDATLIFYPGPSQETAILNAKKTLNDYVESVSRVGYDIKRSAIFAALHQNGVQEVIISSPASDIEVSSGHVAICSDISVVTGGIDT